MTSVEKPSAVLRGHLLVTDLGLMGYWFVAALGVFPPEWLYRGYDNPVIQSWNWSFAPLDLLASSLGFLALALARRGKREWSSVALLSCALTFCAGLMALAFWAIERDFELQWWLPNLYLLVWPLTRLRELFRKSAPPELHR